MGKNVCRILLLALAFCGLFSMAVSAHEYEEKGQKGTWTVTGVLGESLWGYCGSGTLTTRMNIDDKTVILIIKTGTKTVNYPGNISDQFAPGTKVQIKSGYRYRKVFKHLEPTGDGGDRFVDYIGPYWTYTVKEVRFVSAPESEY